MIWLVSVVLPFQSLTQKLSFTVGVAKKEKKTTKDYRTWDLAAA